MRVRRLIFLTTLALIAFLVVLTSCAEKAPTKTSQTTTTTTTSTIAVGIKDITTKEAFNLIKINQGNSNFVILDVRTPDEYNSGHLQNALNLDVNSGIFELEINTLDKNKLYLVYCRTGIRSLNASEIMLGLHFKNIYNMMGGIIQWAFDGYPIVK